MEITDKRTVVRLFGSLAGGDLFIINNCLCVKLETEVDIGIPDGELVNSVCIGTGLLDSVADTAEVEVPEVEIILT